MAGERPDAIVVLGITGDLARQMTFRALYRLELRGLLDGEIIGVGRRELDDGKLRDRARESVAEQEDTIDEEAFSRLADRLSYHAADLKDSACYDRLGRRLEHARCPMFYLETPPALFGPGVEGLAGAGLLDGGRRVLIEKPFGNDLASARALAEELHRHLDESQIYRVDHFLGKLGLEETLYLRSSNALLESVWNAEHLSCVQITMAEDIGLDERGSFYDPVGQLRDDVVNHLMQVVMVAAMELPPTRDPVAIQEAKHVLLRAIRDAEPERYVRGQYRGYREIDGVSPESETETFVALELRIDNPRWAGVPFYIRTGKRMALEQTELRLVFKQRQLPLFLRGDAVDGSDTEPAQFVIRLDPSTGMRMILNTTAAFTGHLSACLDGRLPQEGRGAPTPYEVLLGAALHGERTRFNEQENLEERWRIVQPLLDSPGALHAYEQGSWGPEQAQALVSEIGGWYGPWLTEEAER